MNKVFTPTLVRTIEPLTHLLGRKLRTAGGAVPTRSVGRLRIYLAAGQLHHPTHQTRLVARNIMHTTLCAARLPQHLASPTLRYTVTTERIPDILDRFASFRRAQKFPDAASFRMALSNSASASSFLSLAFSFSSCFIRFAWSMRKPPYSFRQRISVCFVTPIYFAANSCVLP